MKMPGMLDPHEPNYGDLHGGPVRAEEVSYEPHMTYEQKWGTMMDNGYNGMTMDYGKSMHSPGAVMTMTAIESLMDRNMLMLDIVSGYIGSMLGNMLNKSGYSSLDLTAVHWIDFFAIFLARAIADILYHYFVSDTDQFGGSMQEAVAGAVMWFFIMRFFKPNASMQQLAVQFVSTTIVLFAVARVTGWG